MDEHGNVVSNNSYQKPKKKIISNDYSLAKVFGYMFIGLFITTVVSFGLGAIFAYWLSIDPIVASDTLFILMIVSSVLTIILSLIISFSLGKNSALRIAVPAVLYTICIGVMLSSFTIFIEWWLLASAFLITSLIFGLMALISYFAKNMKGVLVVGLGLIIGASMMSLFNLIMYLISPETYTSIYWIITLLLFAGMMFITMYDIWRIKTIAQSGAMSNNLALYCAFTLYVDFIYIFLRILIILIKIKDR